MKKPSNEDMKEFAVVMKEIQTVMEATADSLKDVLKRHPAVVKMGMRVELSKLMMGACVGVLESQGRKPEEARELLETTLVELQAARAFAELMS